MKPTASNRLLLLSFVAILAAPMQSATAAALYWNPSPLSNEWDATSTFWSGTSGGSPASAWIASSDAVFDQAGSYTVNIPVAQTAGSVSVSNAAVTFTGTTVAASSVAIATGATLKTTGDRIAKAGTTPVTVDGTLDLTAGGFGSGHLIQPGGGGIIIGSFRHSGTASFSGNIQDVSVANRSAILWNGGTGGALTLSGNNSGMTGDVIMGVANSVIKLNSASAFSPNSYLRFEGAAGSNLIELATADFTRAWIPAFNIAGNGGLNWTGTNAGFYATGGDRNLTFVTATGGSTPASVVWGSNGLVSSTVVLGATAASGTLTWTNDINLNLATRTFNTGDGSADVDAALSGVLSGTGVSKLTKSGAGVLLLSNTNTYAGGTLIADSQTTANPLRVSNPAALGTGTLTIGGSGNSDKSRLELIGGITLTNTIAGMASRNSAAPNFINLGGNNVITSAIGSGGGGSQTTFQSDAGKLTFTGAVNARQINMTGAGNGEFSNATFALGTNGVTKSGSGTWILKGAANYSGTTTISEGSLVAQRTTSLGLGTGAVTVADGANLTITDHAGSGQLFYANALTIAGTGVNGGGALGFFNSGGFEMSGTIAISGGTTVRTDPAGQSVSSTVTFSNEIAGTDGLTFFGQGANTGGTPRFTLTGANIYTGTTVLTSSGINTTPFTVTLSGGDDRLPVTTDIIFGGTPAGSPAGTFNKSTTLALNGISQQVAGISTANSPATPGGYRIVGASATTSTLVVNNPSAVSFDGVIGGTGTNESNLGLTKNLAGTLTLIGAQAYKGTTTVTAGSLSLNNAFLSDTSAVVIAAGATLNLTHSTTDVVGSLVLNGVTKPNGIYDASNSGGLITGSGKLEVASDPFATFVSVIPNAADRDPNDDPDADGISNAIEFIIGGNPASANDNALLPSQSLVTTNVGNGSADYLKFSFRRTDASAYLAPTAEYDTDLAGTWTTAVNGAAGVVIQTANDGFATGIDRVDVYIPQSLAIAGKLFARLKAVVTP